MSDIAGKALNTDANLINPWGLAPGASGVFWTSNNVTGTSTLFDPDGTIRPLVVAIPGGSPTGLVATAATDSAFDIPNGEATAALASEPARNRRRGIMKPLMTAPTQTSVRGGY